MKACVTIDISKLRSNILRVKECCPRVQFIFPVKCCGNEKVLDTVCQYADGFDISNKMEYQKIQGYIDGKLVCASGPMSFELKDKPDVLISVNSKEMWESGLGVRVNFNDDDRFEKSHFGTPFSGLSAKISESVSYAHFHNSDFRTKVVCQNILESIEKIIKIFPKLETLNIGGHLGEMSFEDAISYINSVRSMIPQHVRLIVEAGDFLISDCGTLHCNVIDSYVRGDRQYVFLNFSKVAQQRWVHPKLDDFYSECKEHIFQTEFYGISCCEGDIFYLGKCHRVSKGDILVFHNISTYSYEWNQAFNGIDKIDFEFV